MTSSTWVIVASLEMRWPENDVVSGSIECCLIQSKLLDLRILNILESHPLDTSKHATFPIIPTE